MRNKWFSNLNLVKHEECGTWSYFVSIIRSSNILSISHQPLINVVRVSEYTQVSTGKTKTFISFYITYLQVVRFWPNRKYAKCDMSLFSTATLSDAMRLKVITDYLPWCVVYGCHVPQCHPISSEQIEQETLSWLLGLISRQKN